MVLFGGTNIMNKFKNLLLVLLALLIIIMLPACKEEPTTILLDGTSSAGKTALTLQLNKVLVGETKVINIDSDFLKSLYLRVIAYVQELYGITLTLDDLDNGRYEQLVTEGTIDEEDAERFTQAQVLIIFDELMAKIKEHDAADKNIVIDWLLDEKEEFKQFYDGLQPITPAFILVYCPFAILVERVQQRAREGDSRMFKNVFEQFGNIYKAAQPDDRPVLDALSRTEVVTLVTQHARGEFESEDVFQEFLAKLLEKLSLDQHDVVQITPRYAHDFIVNTGKYSAERCALHIRAFIAQYKNYTALAKNVK